MKPDDLRNILSALQNGDLSVDEGLERLRHLPFEDVGVALIDHNRELRQGAPEVILGERKTAEQILAIVEKMAERGGNVLVTRLSREKAAPLLELFPKGDYDGEARTFALVQQEIVPSGRGKILVVCAGTSDIPVAREAAVTARMLGNHVDEIFFF